MYKFRNTCIWLLTFSLFACQEVKNNLIFPELPLSDSFTKQGILHVCAYHNTTDYYVYKGVPKGFHYELLKDFAQILDVKLHIDINPNVEEAITKLNTGKYDLIAMSLSITEPRKKTCKFTDPLFYTNRVLVQNTQNSPIKSIQQLHGRTIHVQQGTELKNFLQQLSDSLLLNLNIIELEGITYEDILLQIENNEIELTAIDKNIAQIAAQYMPHLDFSFPLSEKLPVAWAVSLSSSTLQDEINYWLKEVKKNNKFSVIYNRYFKSSYITTLHNSKYYKLKKNTISDFDPIIKSAAKNIQWDWRLLAALIYQESRFDPLAESNLGAIGLMQVMPETAERFGFAEYTEPEDNIRVGTTYLHYLENFFTRYPLDSLERKKFTLAAYNAGPGHVLDAMRLCQAHGKNPYIWHHNVDHFLLNKSKPEFYRDSLVKHGYCDGKQVFNFVNNIIETYTHYQNTISSTSIPY